MIRCLICDNQLDNLDLEVDKNICIRCHNEIMMNIFDEIRDNDLEVE